MTVEVTYNQEKERDELLFSDELTKETETFLKEKIGLNQHFRNPKKWLGVNHPAYRTFIQELKTALLKGQSIESIELQPSFSPSEENIDHNKFSYVTISYEKDGTIEYDNYVVFDSYKKVAGYVAESFGKQKFGDAYKGVDVYPRNYKRKARTLLKEGKVIAPKRDAPLVETKEVEKEAAPKELSKEEKHNLVKEFISFSTKRQEEFPEVTIDEHELPILFSGWLRHNYPEYNHLKEEIWSFAKETKGQLQSTKKPLEDDHFTVVLSDPKSFANAKEYAVQILLESDPYIDGEVAEDLKNSDPKEWKFTEMAILDIQLPDIKELLGLGYTQDSFDYWKQKIESGERPPIVLMRSLSDEGEPSYDLLDGHHKLLVYQKLGVDKVPTLLQSVDPQKDTVFQHYCDSYLSNSKTCRPSWEVSQRQYQEQKAIERTGNSMVLNARDRQEHERIVEAAVKEGLQVPKEVLEDYPELTKEEDSADMQLSEKIGRPNTYIYDSFIEFEGDVLYQMEVQGELIRSDAQGIVMIPKYGAHVEERFEQLANPTPVDAATVAKEVLDLSIVKEEKPSEVPTKPLKGTSIVGEIDGRDKKIPNVLLPEDSSEPFWSGSIFWSNSELTRETSPNLLNLTNDNLDTASAVELFELSQMAHPTEHGFLVNRSDLLSEWEKRGEKAFKEIGFPTNPDHPYVNIHIGYKSVSSLGRISEESKWWSVVEHYRPIADPVKALEILDFEIGTLYNLRAQTINPKTGKPKGSEKEKYQRLTFDIESLLANKELIEDFIKSSNRKPKKSPKKKQKGKSDYLDRVIAHMHDEYGAGKRVTKGQVEKLAKELKIPNMGIMWEAVELSWMLWYRSIYREPIPFEMRLRKMIHFWYNVQPTYAYSDSSKEIYKQYSTPCPIGAIVAQYTGMDSARRIFEPSAGNGLLLVGADPLKTHANEIDKTRLKSLEFLEFDTITSYNATEPFPSELEKAFDVVVTNPPFSRWEEEKFDKEYVIRTYFHSHVGLARNIRLEHVMSGLALHTMKDKGRAAIIIMGHLYFGADGLIGKYRPFFNWLFRHYHVDDVINMNSFKLYNKQGAIEKTMLMLVSGRKSKPDGVAPQESQAPHLYDLVNSFQELWERVKPHIKGDLDTVINQLKTELGQ